ncbi:MAG: SRPBCC family protein [Dehalococcoidia bacterium]
MSKGLIAKASINISSPISRVWEALTNPEVIKQYMFGTNVVSDWKEGSQILWKGEWQGKVYEDKGVILKLEPHSLIQYSHFSPLSELPDAPENYHIVTIELSGKGPNTLVSLSQDNNSSENQREHSEKNWEMMLVELKRILEK